MNNMNNIDNILKNPELGELFNNVIKTINHNIKQNIDDDESNSDNENISPNSKDNNTNMDIDMDMDMNMDMDMDMDMDIKNTEIIHLINTLKSLFCDKNGNNIADILSELTNHIKKQNV